MKTIKRSPFVKSLYAEARINAFFIIILFCAFFVRFYNFTQRVNFGPEQAMSLIVSGRYLSEKFSLLGQMYFREATQSHHVLFSGAIFNYALVPLQLVFNYDPVKITAIFTLINILTGALVYIFVLKVLGKMTAIFSSLYFLFNSYMIYHSLFIWNYNLLPLLFLIQIYLTHEFIKTNRKLYIFYIGILSGLGFSIQYLYFLPAVIIFLVLINKSKNKIIFFTYLLGCLAGNIPMVIFDLKHNFYHLRTLLDFALGQFSAKEKFSLKYYHFLYLWPLFSTVAGVLTNKIYRKHSSAAFLLVLTYIGINMVSGLVNLKAAVGMPEGLSSRALLDSAKYISVQKESRFNVVETYDFDSRANVLRYPLEFMYGKKPLDQDSYAQADAVYVLSPLGYDYNNPTPWEIKTYMPYKYSLVYRLNDKWGVFKLVK